MKSCEEIVENIFKRKEEYMEMKRKRERGNITVAVSVCCLCIIAVGSTLLWKTDALKNTSVKTAGDSVIKGEKDYYDGALPADEGSGGADEMTDGVYSSVWSNDENNYTAPHGDTSAVSSTDESSDNSDTEKQLFFINEIKNEVNKAVLKRDPEKHYTEEWDNPKMAEYLGVDLSQLDLSFNRDCKCYLPDIHYVTYENGGELVEDRAVFGYKGGGLSFSVLVSRIRVPYDTVYETDTRKETVFNTENNGRVKVLISATVGTLTDSDIKEEKLMIADFEIDGMYFRIKAENVKISDFGRILDVILNIE